MEELGEAIRESRLESLAEPGRPAKSLLDHRAIARAIRDGDREGARRAMQAHLEHVADVRLLAWRPEDEGA